LVGIRLKITCMLKDKREGWSDHQSILFDFPLSSKTAFLGWPFSLT
jgi:hypothetical protein